MPCVVVKMPGFDGYAIVKMARSRKRCGWCDRAHIALCDHDMGGGKTCDMPLCDRHAEHHAGDIDYCPLHAGAPHGQ
jgi:hypothetical protein